jgi:hypothetical protein
MADKTFRNESVRLSDIAAPKNAVIPNTDFLNCDLIGPAVVVMTGCTMSNCDLGTNAAEPLLYEVADGRDLFIGVVVLDSCTIDRCRFINVGFAGPPSFTAQIRDTLNGPPPQGPVGPKSGGGNGETP